RRADRAKRIKRSASNPPPPKGSRRLLAQPRQSPSSRQVPQAARRAETATLTPELPTQRPTAAQLDRCAKRETGRRPAPSCPAKGLSDPSTRSAQLSGHCTGSLSAIISAFEPT